MSNYGASVDTSCASCLHLAFNSGGGNYAINNIARISPSQEVMLISSSDEIYFGSDSPAMASVDTCCVSCLHRASIQQKGMIKSAMPSVTSLIQEVILIFYPDKIHYAINYLSYSTSL